MSADWALAQGAGTAMATTLILLYREAVAAPAVPREAK